MQIRVEVCVDSIECAQIAQLAGAHRIELNSALQLDGLSPTPGLLMGVLESVDLPVISMARPRSGDFCYSDAEWKVLKDDASWMLDMGAAGIAVGCVDQDRQIDEPRLAEIREMATGRDVVFHLAFDAVANWKSAVDILVKQGVNQLMTRGQAPTALEGAAHIGQVIGYAGDRIEVLPAGRIDSSNVKAIADQTGCQQIHGSFCSQVDQSSSAASQFKQMLIEIAATVGQIDGSNKTVSGSEPGS